MPVSYANAFGGKEHASNPIGKGIDSITGDDGEFTPLPNIEFKNKLVGSTSDRPYPAAFSRLDISWPERIKLAGTYDQKHIARIGHLHDCIAYGPGILDLAHQPDEYIVIDDMVTAAKVMAASTLELLGVNL